MVGDVLIRYRAGGRLGDRFVNGLPPKELSVCCVLRDQGGRPGGLCGRLKALDWWFLWESWGVVRHLEDVCLGGTCAAYGSNVQSE